MCFSADIKGTLELEIPFTRIVRKAWFIELDEIILSYIAADGKIAQMKLSGRTADVCILFLLSLFLPFTLQIDFVNQYVDEIFHSYRRTSFSFVQVQFDPPSYS
jgi:hypothetical protein